MSLPSPTIVLYTKPGCHLCDESRQLLDALLAERAAAGMTAPPIEERNILSNEAWERDYAFEIPVVELGGRTLTLATSASRLRHLLAEVLDNAVIAG
jgi:glutaredoxin-like protein DUF836